MLIEYVRLTAAVATFGLFLRLGWPASSRQQLLDLQCSGVWLALKCLAQVQVVDTDPLFATKVLLGGLDVTASFSTVVQSALGWRGFHSFCRVACKLRCHCIYDLAGRLLAMSPFLLQSVLGSLSCHGCDPGSPSLLCPFLVHQVAESRRSKDFSILQLLPHVANCRCMSGCHLQWKGESQETQMKGLIARRRRV